jgi:hypothetical protein
MKHLLCAFTISILGSCMVVDPSHFRYLDEDSLEFNRVLITGAERDVEISLPRSLAMEFSEALIVDPESLQRSYTSVLKFPYEWLWGGPIHKDRGLYLFELGFKYDGERNLLSESVSSRIQTMITYYEEFEEGSWRDYVLDNLVVEEYSSQQGYRWVMKNLPTVMRFHEVFHLPISDEHQLVVWFWYNEDWVKDNPEWYERRKALSRRILDTVKLSEP